MESSVFKVCHTISKVFPENQTSLTLIVVVKTNVWELLTLKLLTNALLLLGTLKCNCCLDKLRGGGVQNKVLVKVFKKRNRDLTTYFFKNTNTTALSKSASTKRNVE